MMKSMGKKVKTAYFCSRCGVEHSKWQGQCRECLEWNVLIEEKVRVIKQGRAGTKVLSPTRLSDVADQTGGGYRSGIIEFDRVLGGQLLPGMTILIGGEPGIGKSTLLLQVAEAYAKSGLAVLYVTGEESLPQIKVRSARLGVKGDRIDVVNDTNLENIMATIGAGHYNLVLVDSIQTVSSDQFDSPPGSIAQVREAANALVKLSKQKDIGLFLVGHVTKEGLVAGPKVLEHIVDTVISFEGDPSHLYRILRATKNRFGSVLEIGLFEMTQGGLEEVVNPSSLFLGDHEASGKVVAGVCEGNRPLMVEVQALVTAANYGNPQRVAGGIDGRKLALLLAILEKRCDYPMAANDVFVSVAGGLKISEPALDLPVMVSVVSSLMNRVIDRKTVVIGEVGLSGEIRGVTNPGLRVAEASRLGFRRVIVPKSNAERLGNGSIEIAGVDSLQDALEICLG